MRSETNMLLPWGMIGGGEDSQIGYTHRAAACLDRRFSLVAGALDVDPQRGRRFAQHLGIEAERSYGTWQEMIASEAQRPDRVRLITIATPNSTHYSIAKACLETGFDVLCEKPLTATVKEAEELVSIAKQKGRICAVNYGYSGYALVRQMRSMIAQGELGHIRVVVGEFAGDFFADADDADNARVRWRFDPKFAGGSAVTADAGIHVLHMACFVTGQEIVRVSSDFAHGVSGRILEDDSLSAFRMSKGTIGRLWTSGLAIGRAHGLTLQVFGEKGGFAWSQESPNELKWTPLNQPTQVLRRGDSALSLDAQRANRLSAGHAEGMIAAFANLYVDLADAIVAGSTAQIATTLPKAEEGLHSLRVLTSMITSARNEGSWCDVETCT